MDLWGPIRLVLQSIQDLQGDSSASFRDSAIAQKARMPLKKVRDCLAVLHENEFISLTGLVDGLSASIEAKGRVALTLPSGVPIIISSSIKVVPKGLRPFGASDSDFFLDLLPGPRNQSDLPVSISYWKERIEKRDPDRTFRVGVIYGPSGCGKTSLVKAGLVPNLTDDILVVDVEATPDETESLLLKSLGKKCSGVAGAGLAQVLSVLSKGSGLPEGKTKVLLVIDQFEQWLHANRSVEGSELAASLKNCDGKWVQAIIMVRDDFWMALTRFMAELGVEMRQDLNYAALDLFKERHARKVLTLFGQGFETLPSNPEAITNEQRLFVRKAVSQLSEREGIAPVRLALFAQMMAEKDWLPETLREVGGSEGLGLRFLEDTFDSQTGRRNYLIGEEDVVAVQSVLRKLLPDSGLSIRGRTRTYKELYEASGLTGHWKRFEELLSILDTETRLITPTERARGVDGLTPKTSSTFYQLSHDYLVPPIRMWLSRKQGETRQGRAELRLSDYSAFWNEKPENRRLPSVFVFLNILTFTRSNYWDESQTKMMRSACRYHGIRALFATLVMAFVGWAANESYRQVKASGLIEAIRRAETKNVPPLIEQLEPYRTWANPRLVRMLKEPDKASNDYLHASLAHLPVDATQVNYLYHRMLNSNPSELPILWDALRPHRTQLIPQLWSVLESAKPDDDRLLRGASALALYDPENPRWAEVGDKVAEALVSVNSVNLGDWLRYLSDLRSKLKPHLATIFQDGNLSESERTQATNILADYARDDPALLADLLLDSVEKPFAVLFDRLKAHQDHAVPLLEAELAKSVSSEAKDDEKDQLAKRQARAAVALVRLEQGEKVWNLLRHSPDPSVRSYIVNCLKPLGAEPKALMTKLKALMTKLEGIAHDPVSIPKDGKSRMEAILFHPETSERRALILALGKYNADDLSPTEREPLMTQLLEAYRNDPDSGIHGAAEWILRQWKQQEKLQAANAELMKQKDRGHRRWFVNGQGQTFAVIKGPVEFRMGSPPTETERHAESEGPWRMRIPRRFAIAAKEVTVEQFQRFLKLGAITIDRYPVSASFLGRSNPDPEGPWTAPDWYMAAYYCNWLSEQEGLPKDQWCYRPNEAGAYAEGMSIPADVLQRTGYRLPTEAEWEFTCRAGAVTSRYYGNSINLLDAYARYRANSKDHAWSCGSLLPNDLGLFDMLGNMCEWCQDSLDASRPEKEGVYNDIISISESIKGNPRNIRGGSFLNQPANVRSAYRFGFQPSIRNVVSGFRLARTYYPGKKVSHP